jgi:sulfur carrier protein ThiS
MVMIQMMTIKLARLGGEIKEYAMAEGSNIASLLETAGLDSTGFSTAINAELVKSDRILSNNDTVIVTPASVKQLGAI